MAFGRTPTLLSLMLSQILQKRSGNTPYIQIDNQQPCVWTWSIIASSLCTHVCKPPYPDLGLPFGRVRAFSFLVRSIGHVAPLNHSQPHTISRNEAPFVFLSRSPVVNLSPSPGLPLEGEDIVRNTRNQEF
ncbi:hypothetical protein VFPPC_16800 [Pochonia chlamydosporia 170]|uniref:Uncharacterized protein n=1 Tax=Pochonia chlamydosporia 170 TaxID=1380566 RepID=A0A179F311_METCM|nr:hypothetical protein VFPPC_16800 [Pochonia chlamydosporia 170]OAQ59812.1 hypothetical protein VFPPC_16800 [Pochonia chlamydosporia 170]